MNFASSNRCNTAGIFLAVKAYATTFIGGTFQLFANITLNLCFFTAARTAIIVKIAAVHTLAAFPQLLTQFAVNTDVMNT
jgi:hypothetical protein